MSIPDTTKHPIIMFDGFCNFCNGLVNFIIKYDEKRRFRFAALQSDAGRAVKANFQVPESYADSVVLIYKQRVLYKSSAALRVFRLLGGVWSFLILFLIVPPFMRDWIYDFIVRNRYKWYGSRESCRIPTPAERELFL